MTTTDFASEYSPNSVDCPANEVEPNIVGQQLHPWLLRPFYGYYW